MDIKCTYGLPGIIWFIHVESLVTLQSYMRPRTLRCAHTRLIMSMHGWMSPFTLKCAHACLYVFMHVQTDAHVLAWMCPCTHIRALNARLDSSMRAQNGCAHAKMMKRIFTRTKFYQNKILFAVQTWARLLKKEFSWPICAKKCPGSDRRRHFWKSVLPKMLVMRTNWVGHVELQSNGNIHMVGQ